MTICAFQQCSAHQQEFSDGANATPFNHIHYDNHIPYTLLYKFAKLICHSLSWYLHITVKYNFLSNLKKIRRLFPTYLAERRDDLRKPDPEGSFKFCEITKE